MGRRRRHQRTFERVDARFSETRPQRSTTPQNDVPDGPEADPARPREADWELSIFRNLLDAVVRCVRRGE